MQISKSNIDKFKKVKLEYEEHHDAANLERQYYNNIIKKSKNDLSTIHIYYDWAQSISIPYSLQQVRSIYFKSAFVVNLFGICRTGQNNKQINFIISENELLTGTAKGANITLNMVYKAIKMFIQNEDDLKKLVIIVLHKTKTIYHFFLMLVMYTRFI